MMKVTEKILKIETLTFDETKELVKVILEHMNQGEIHIKLKKDEK